MTSYRGVWLALACVLASVFSCQSDDPSGPTVPSNLTLTADIATDGSGKVILTAHADDAKYYTFVFGDVLGQTPQKATNGAVIHTYEQSGTYTVLVTANADASVFIEHTEEIDVEVFFSIPTTGYTTPESYAGMSLLWSDEFSGSSLSLDKWTHEVGDGCPNVCGWGNNELEYYKGDNTTLTDGYLIIEAKKESAGSKAYTSSRIITKNKFSFKYGRIDVRAVLPEGQGIWPAIWMLGSSIDTESWPKCGEIDIMEMIGGSGREKTVHGTVHWDNSGSYAYHTGDYDLASGTFADEFHVFSLVWTENTIIWYVDDVQFNIIDITPAGLSEFREEFFMILNVAVGGNWPGSPDGSTKFPQRMIVDYVRVFQNQ